MRLSSGYHPAYDPAQACTTDPDPVELVLSTSPESREVGEEVKVESRPTSFYCVKPRHFQKNFRHFRNEKGGDHDAELKNNLDKKGTSMIATREEKLLLISGKNEVGKMK